MLALLGAISAGEHRLAPIGLDRLEAASVLDRQHVDRQLGLTDCIVMTLALGWMSRCSAASVGTADDAAPVW